MEITLEKIELVKDRTGVSYKEAKDALEKAEGNVVDAIISIEETVDVKRTGKANAFAEETVGKIKELVKKGNISKIAVKKDDEVILNIPLSLGVIGLIWAPWGALFATIAAFGLKCKIELTTDEGKIIDISEKAEGVITTVKEKGSVVVDEVVARGTETFNDLKEKAPETWEEVKVKGVDAFNSIKDTATEKYNEMMSKKDRIYEESDMDDIFDDILDEEDEEESFDVDVKIDADLNTEEGIKEASEKIQEVFDTVEESMEEIEINLGEEIVEATEEVQEGTKKFSIFHRK